MSILYIVATPIGNLQDMSARAIAILQSVDVIAAEDTRHSKPLLTHFGITTPMVAYHEHNEASQSEALLKKLIDGCSIALISDAGTPLISDPGYSLVHQARLQGITVEPVPGACALIAALSASGLPTDSFYFAGFLPTKNAAKEKRLQQLSEMQTTLIFYESPRRVVDTLSTMQAYFSAKCQCVVAREVTKKFSSFYSGTLKAVHEQLLAHPDEQRGEFVIMLHEQKPEATSEVSDQAKTIMKVLLTELSVKQAAKLTAEITGEKKNVLYEWAIIAKANSR